ncbi:MAG: UDP-N-acetylmuramate dehydrogenase [Anaerolineales bacterium]|nr:UDP-N-acetylmuramate dehydrogenase [Anaerolineales bacterium]
MQLPLEEMRREFGERLEEQAPLARLTSARLGGPADALITVGSADELAQAVRWLWERSLPWRILGGGANMLVSDRGFRGVVVLNRARRIEFDETPATAGVWAESGANFGLISRQAGLRGLAGLEWAVGIPGTLGGAVVGNAGAHGADLSGNLVLAEILHHPGQEVARAEWPVEQLGYTYRSSMLKQQPGKFVVLSAALRLERSTPEAVQAKMEVFNERRQRTQPPGATMGSMFKNPEGNYAGRLIEAAGLKGTCIGDAEISTRHGNFFINRGAATAADFSALIELAQKEVWEKFGIQLELEVERIGDWQAE